MASELLYQPLHLIPSAWDQKVEAKPGGRSTRECSQGRAEMRGREVARLPSSIGSHLGRSRGRATPSLAKSVLLTSFETGRAAAYAVSGVLSAPVVPVVMCCKPNVHLTDEVPRRPLPSGLGVSSTYKSNTKGLADAPVTGTGSPRPRLQGCRQSQSRGAGWRLPASTCLERQNLRVPCGPLRFMGPVSPAIAATQWPGGTSSRQLVGLLRNSPQQPKPARAAVRSR